VSVLVGMSYPYCTMAWGWGQHLKGIILQHPMPCAQVLVNTRLRKGPAEKGASRVPYLGLPSAYRDSH